MSKILTTSMVIIAMAITFVAVRLAMSSVLKNDSVQLTQQAKDTTLDNAHRSAFVNGCVGEGAEWSVCNCAYSRLIVMYPDFATNEARMNRILTEGYNQRETDTMMMCVASEV